VVEIKGIEKFSSRDFPATSPRRYSSGGCTFRCPLLPQRRPRPAAGDDPDDAGRHLPLLSRRPEGWLEAVCLTGGEPLLQENIEDLIRVVRERGLLVKLDTNGSLADRLENLLAAGLLDRVAMDIKAPLERYRDVTRSNVAVERVVRSADLIRSSASDIRSGRRPSRGSSAGRTSSRSESGSKGRRATSSSSSSPDDDRSRLPRRQALRPGRARVVRRGGRALFQRGPARGSVTADGRGRDKTPGGDGPSDPSFER